MYSKIMEAKTKSIRDSTGQHFDTKIHIQHVNTQSKLLVVYASQKQKIQLHNQTKFNNKFTIPVDIQKHFSQQPKFST